MDTKSCVVMKDQFDRIQAAKLKIHNKKFSVYKGVNVIGRNKSAAIDVKNLNVSQYHALIIIIDDSQHFISDLNSSNGTYLFGTRLSPFKLYELANDTEIKFGDVVGLYLKMPNMNATIHLESESMDVTQPSQNFTQTFYAANTQILPDDSTLNETVSFKVPRQPSLTRDTEDIHEAATQVVDYPSTIPNGSLGINENSNVIIETVSSDIHDAPTQVVTLPLEQPSTSKVGEVDIHEAPTQPVTDRLEENIHEAVTKVISAPQEKIDTNDQKGDENQESDSATQIVTPVNSEKLTAMTGALPSTSDSFSSMQEMTNVNVNQDSVIEESVIEDSVIEENTKENQREAVVSENSNDSLDFLSISKQSNMETTQGNDTNEHDDKSSTISDSQDIEKPKKRLVRKLSSSEDLSHDNEMICNSDSETDIGDNENSKKKTLLSNSKHKTNNSDSETDIEDDLPQKRNNRNKIIGSDSETDIEDDIQDRTLTETDDTVKPKILSKKVNFNSDSETDIEDDKENEQIRETAQDGNSTAAEILNDTDCIPATQDAFADMFDYKNSKPSNSNVSSEESFKLGLTELMIDEELNSKLNELDEESEENNIENQTTNQMDGKPSTSTTTETITKQTEDELYMMPTQKINEKEPPEKKDDDIYLMPTQMLATADIPVIENDPCLPRMTSTVEKESDDNIYLMPTQTFNENEHKKDDIYSMATQELTAKDLNKIKDTPAKEDDDMYMMATQKINDDDANFKVPQKFTFKKKPAILDRSLTGILGSKQDDDPYSTPTQKIDEVDDIYMQPTQKLDDNKSQKEEVGDTKQNETNDAYMEPTQELNHAGPSNERKKVEEDPYAASTQQIDQFLVNKENLEKSNVPEVNVYAMETQKLEVAGDQLEDSASDIGKPANEGLYDQPTQLLSSIIKENQNQSNSTVSNKDAVSVIGDASNSSSKGEESIGWGVPKRKRMKKSDIENLKKTIESKNRVDDSETLSQIEAFVKKPLEKSERVVYDDDRPETLSQIEAFIKKPLDNTKKLLEYGEQSGSTDITEKTEGKKYIKSETWSGIKASINKPMDKSVPQSTKDPSLNKDEEADPVETLSQIEAFVRQPLDIHSPKQLQNTEKPVKTSARISRARQSKIIKEGNQPEKEATGKSKSTSKVKSETSSDEGYVEQKDGNTNKNVNTSRSDFDTVKSDVDQSFALLEAKSTKTRKSLRATGASEIRVAVCRNRRSMATTSIAELPGNEGKTKPSTRNTRRMTAMENPEPTTSGTKAGEKTKRKHEAAKIEQKSNDSSDSDFSEHEIPAKIIKVNVARRGKGKVSGNTITKLASSEESNRGKLSMPSTSKMRTSSRMKSSEINENTKSSDSESTTSSNDPSFSTPSRRGRNTVLSESLLKSAERTKRKQRPKVVFTMLDNPLLETYIKQLGGSVVDSVEASTVLVTEHVKRSQKLLAAVGQGKPICSPSWIYASKKANEFLDPWDYILVDKEAEFKWSFSLKDSISKAAEEKLLSNYTFQIMVNSAVDVLKGAIEACGGKCANRAPARNAEGFFVIVASPENRNKYLKIKKQHPEVTVVEPEAIFDGVLRQDLRLGRHLLT